MCCLSGDHRIIIRDLYRYTDFDTAGDFEGQCIRIDSSRALL